MIGMVAVFRVVPGSEQAFELAYSELAAGVLADEPGTRLYQLCRSRTEHGVYKVMEIFESQEALDTHMKSERVKSSWPSIAPLLAERPTLEFLDVIELI